MNLGKIINEVADALEDAVVRSQQRQEQSRDFLDALQQDLRNAAEVVDQINFTALEQLKRGMQKANPLKDARVDWSQFGDFVKKAEQEFKTEPNKPLTQDEKVDWLRDNVGGIWSDPAMIDLQKFYRNPQHEKVLNYLYNQYQSRHEA
jgi:hypothetical protein